METNIILVGMPACGKTTVGKLLADKLYDYTLIDTDSFIEKTSGMSIKDIFAKYSEDYFRKLEYDAIKLLCNGNRKILSLGGGAFENPDNRATLLKYGKVFYLKSDLDVLYYRISKDNSRPLLNNENPRQALEMLYKKREENFNKAHFVVDTDKLSENEIVDIILGSMYETNPQS
ncbi:shikimate kinase [bacterium]|nr:shikimate kinase [bacterium]